MAGPFSRLLSARPGLRLLALAGAGSLAAGFLLRPEPIRAASERRRLYPPRYQCLRHRGGVGELDVVTGTKMGMEMRTWAKEKGYNHESSGVECCTIWRPQWVGDGSQNHKANAFLGTCNPQSPPPRPALTL